MDLGEVRQLLVIVLQNESVNIKIKKRKSLILLCMMLMGDRRENMVACLSVCGLTDGVYR